MRSMDAAIAANRFGLGAKPGDDRLIGPAPREWLQAQLTAPTVPASTPAAVGKLVAVTDLRMTR